MIRIVLFAIGISIFVFGAYLSFAGTVDLDLGHSSKAEGLCNKGEKLMFDCNLENGNEISLCSSQVVNQRSGWIKYRYGSVGAIQTEIPTDKTRPQQVFKFYREARFQSEKRYLRFEQSGNKYEVFEEDYMTQGKHVVQSGVRIGTTQYRCTDKPKGHLRKFEGLVPYDK